MKHITKETAILAKEKGFRESVEWAYQEDKLVHNSRYRSEENWNENSDVDCAAPLQYELKDWLREKYEIHVELIPKLLYPEMIIGMEYYYTIHYKNKEIDDDGVYEYEEALEAGLKHALTLINLNKNSTRP